MFKKIRQTRMHAFVILLKLLHLEGWDFKKRNFVIVARLRYIYYIYNRGRAFRKRHGEGKRSKAEPKGHLMGVQEGPKWSSWDDLFSTWPNHKIWTQYEGFQWFLGSSGLLLGPELLQHLILELLEACLSHPKALGGFPRALGGILERSWRLLECSWSA